MKKNADFIRQGQGGYAWMREQTITQGLEELKDKLKDAQASLQGKGPGKNAARRRVIPNARWHR